MNQQGALKIGIDTGGTYTDAVLMRGDTVIAKAKSLTTRDDLAIGVHGALSQVLATDVADAIEFVALSTTLATNGLVEKQGGRVGLLLIGFDESPLPRAGLAEALGGDPVYAIAGGHNANGEERFALDEAAIEAAVLALRDQVDAIAINAFFAVRNSAHEQRARDIVQRHCPLPISCGHQLSSSLDAPRRALTSVVNARLIPLIAALLGSTHKVMQQLGVTAPLMVVKGDGSLIAATEAAHAPVETILSGPAASVVGARHLSQAQNLVVADMGGTTLDIAFIQDGEPKLSDQGAVVGGFNTMVRAVQVHTYGLGGDSWIQFDRSKHVVTFGPRRVVPLSLLALDHPHIVAVMERQLERGWAVTHDGLFARVRPGRGDTKKMSGKQRDLWAGLSATPVAVSALFKDQTQDRTLLRLVERDWVALAGFTPTDAARVLGLTEQGSLEAATLGAEQMRRYCAANLGQRFDDVESFCRYIRAAATDRAAECLLDASTTEVFGGKHPLPSMYSDMALARSSNPLFKLQLQLAHPVAGIGAPAHSYLPGAGTTLGSDYLRLDHAEVANAVGAVVGLVRAEVRALITPLPNDRYRLHTPSDNTDHSSLEDAAAVALTTLRALATEQAQQSGAGQCEITESRNDVVVREGDQSIFFESRVVVVATGRPAF